jgi:hypothetical protein
MAFTSLLVYHLRRRPDEEGAVTHHRHCRGVCLPVRDPRAPVHRLRVGWRRYRGSTASQGSSLRCVCARALLRAGGWRDDPKRGRRASVKFPAFLVPLEHLRLVEFLQAYRFDIDVRLTHDLPPHRLSVTCGDTPTFARELRPFDGFAVILRNTIAVAIEHSKLDRGNNMK